MCLRGGDWRDGSLQLGRLRERRLLAGVLLRGGRLQLRSDNRGLRGWPSAGHRWLLPEITPENPENISSGEC